MECPDCGEEMVLEYGEMGEEEWNCHNCNIWVEVRGGEIVRKFELEEAE